MERGLMLPKQGMQELDLLVSAGRLVVVCPEVNIYNTRYSGGPSAREVLSEDNECTPDCSEGER